MAGERELLEKHTLVVRDGRILEIAPADAAEQHYAPRVSLERPSHLLDARTGQCPHEHRNSARRGRRAGVLAGPGRARHRQHAQGGGDGVLRRRLFSGRGCRHGRRAGYARGHRVAGGGLPKRLGPRPRGVPDARAEAARRVQGSSLHFHRIRSPATATPSRMRRSRVSARWRPSSMRASSSRSIARGATSMSAWPVTACGRWRGSSPWGLSRRHCSPSMP